MEDKESDTGRKVEGRKLFNTVGFSIRPIVAALGTLAILLIIYVTARPLLYYSNDDCLQQGLTSAVKSIGSLPDKDWDSSRVDSLITLVNPPIMIPLGIFATAKVPIALVSFSTNDTVRPPTERWLRGENWTANTYLKVQAAPPKLQYNWDFIILAIGSAIVAIVGLWSFYKPSASEELPSLSGSLTGSSAPASVPASAEEYMAVDVQRALDRSEQLLARSTLLLVGGVVMAFIGVGVFFLSPFSSEALSLPTNQVALSVPSPAPILNITPPLGGGDAHVASLADLLSSRGLLLAFRSFAMLLFIESIAWFLLRQYRALIEDYKSFYRYYMRRANYLAALKISNQRGGDAQFALIVRTFLAEELTGRLKKDETTEGIEAQRFDQNIVEVLAVPATAAVKHATTAPSKAKHAETGNLTP